jgi:hypothetical protein
MKTSIAPRLSILVAILASFASRSVLAQDEAHHQGSDPGSDRPTQGVAGLAVLLQTKDGRTEFHFGEMVELKVQYAALQPGRYVHVNLNELKGGHSWQWQCEPVSQVVNRRNNNGEISASRFYYARENCGEGIGAGSGGGCGDCGGEDVLGPVPLSYDVLLNNELQFLQPGRYTCRVSTADVATPATSPGEERTAIELVSNPVVIDLNEDPVWSATTLSAARQQFSGAHCLGLPDESARCWDPVNTIRFLDTEESLAELVGLYKGLNKASWQELLWLGILQSQHPKLARELLEKRMVDSDFTVTAGFLDTLTAMALREDHPEALNAPVPEGETSIYHDQTLEVLRNYLRTVGKHLPEKWAATRAESLETYTRYAGQTFCEDKPLIPSAEARKVVAAAKRSQH